MLKTKEKIYIYNRNRIIYTKDNKSYFKYNRKYILLNNDDNLYTNAKSIVYKYIGGFVGEGGNGEERPVENVNDSSDIDSSKKEKEDNNKKCQDFYKVFSKVIINKIKNIIKNKDNYTSYIKDIYAKANEEKLNEEKEKNEQDKQKDKRGEEECPTIIDSKIINIYFIDNLFKKYIVDIIYDDDNIEQILNNIYPIENENEKTNNENEKKNCLNKISNSIKNKKDLFDKFQTFWEKKKDENCGDDIDGIKSKEDDYYKKEPFTKIKNNTKIIEYDKMKLKEYLQSIVDYNLNKEINKYYKLYIEIMNIKN